MKLTKIHNLPEKEILRHVLKSDIADIYFYTNIVVVEAFEGVTLSYKTAFSVLLKSLQLFGIKPCIYIANRVNSYSVNPNDYKYLNKINTLKGIAIVTQLEEARNNAELERKFSKKPFEIFENIEEAYKWGINILNK